MWGATIDGLISISIGLLACYYGFRNPPVSSNPTLTTKWQQWHLTWGTWAKVGGVVLVLFGLFKIITALG
jgi:hypothetical protein